MGFKLSGKDVKVRRSASALLGTSAVLALAGCSGGGSNIISPGGTASNSGLASANLAALTTDNRLVTFNSRTPDVSTTVSITGLTTGDSLRAIDFRFTPPSNTTGFNNGLTGLYGIARNGTSLQLYRIVISANTATATRVGTRFNLIPASPTAEEFGFDFNPTVDRIRLIEPNGNRDIRLNPNVDANTSPVVDGDPVAPGVQGDGPITYAAGDPNFGQNPDAVGAAYTNVDADTATGTTLYVLDAARNTLATQGRADDPATVGVDESVGPNTGTLFTVANLNINVTEDTGFDIAPNGNAAFLSSGNQIFGIAVAPGAGRGTVSGGARVTAPDSSRIIGVAVLP